MQEELNEEAMQVTCPWRSLSILRSSRSQSHSPDDTPTAAVLHNYSPPDTSCNNRVKKKNSYLRYTAGLFSSL